jgi:hypothetical protein
MAAWALSYNNPMAIIQAKPDKWEGLVGSVNGKLQFNAMSNGVRAGVINLYNGYFKKGNNTLRGIFKVYAPSGDGANNPLNYANFVAGKLKVSIDKPLDFEEVVIPLSLAIIKMETGTTIPENQFLVGLYAGIDKLGFAVEGGTLKTVTVTGKKNGKSKWWLWLLIAGAGYTIYKKRK